MSQLNLQGSQLGAGFNSPFLFLIRLFKRIIILKWVVLSSLNVIVQSWYRTEKEILISLSL